MTMPIVCTIAGSDVSGGAGIQSDLHTFHNLGVHGCSVVTAITAQSLDNVSDIYYLPQAVLRAELQSLHQDVRAIKIGMLGNRQIIDVLAEFLDQYNGFVVLDPVLISSSGRNLYDGALSDYLDQLKQLFPAINLLTPNIRETEAILGRSIISHDDIKEAAHELLSFGINSVYIKGGHAICENSDDYWSNGDESFWLISKRYDNRNIHGTGCVLSSAIVSCVALGYHLKDALVIAKMYVNRGIRCAEPKDTATFFQHQLGWPEEEIDLPMLNARPIDCHHNAFMRDDLFQVGLYPIVDSVEWLKRLLPLGIKCIQLRIKDIAGEELTSIIQESVVLAKQYRVILFINDYWQLAIAYGADGVHLGQEDLHLADVQAIQAAGLRLGISTHCYAEVARAHFYHPSYIACGPIFETTSKLMSFAPQGVLALMRWRKTLSYPLVAIGGIGQKNIIKILEANVDGIALISAITKAENPVLTTEQLIKMVNSYAAE